MLMLVSFVVLSCEASLANLELLIEVPSLGSKFFTVVAGKALNECFQQENLGTDKNSLLENVSLLQGGWAGSHLKVSCAPSYSVVRNCAM